MCFLMNFAKHLITPFFTEHLRVIASVITHLLFKGSVFYRGVEPRGVLTDAHRVAIVIIS